MKNLLLPSLLLLLFVTGFSQTVKLVSFSPKWERIPFVKKEQFNKAKVMGDFIPGYYSSYWSTKIDFVSVEISATCDGKSVTSKGGDDVITPEQKRLLNSADAHTAVLVKLKFKFKNENGKAGEKTEELGYAVTVSPDIEAEFAGGEIKMSQYLNENIFDKVSDAISLQRISRVMILFTIDEEGQITDPRIYRYSGDMEPEDPEIEKLLLDAIAKMPKWKPAENSKGKKVKQELIFRVGSAGC